MINENALMNAAQVGMLVGRDDENMKRTHMERRRKEASCQLYLEAVAGGFIVQRPDAEYGQPVREVVSSPEALVAVVQRWAKDATER